MQAILYGHDASVHVQGQWKKFGKNKVKAYANWIEFLFDKFPTFRIVYISYGTTKGSTSFIPKGRKKNWIIKYAKSIAHKELLRDGTTLKELGRMLNDN